MNTIVNKKSVLEMAMGGILQITDYEVWRLEAKHKIAEWLCNELEKEAREGQVIITI